MARVTLIKVDPFSLGKLQGAVLAAAGILFGVIFATSAVLAALSNGRFWSGLVFAIAALFAVPLLYGILGFFTGYVGALIYNLAAKTLGGIRVVLEFEPGEEGVKG